MAQEVDLKGLLVFVSRNYTTYLKYKVLDSKAESGAEGIAGIGRGWAIQDHGPLFWLH